MSEYTYEMWDRMRCIDRIEGLSRDAAIEVARANSIAGHCTVSTHHCCDSFGTEFIKVLTFKNGRQVGEHIAGAEMD